ncbi:MAG: MFS transporter [Planctomycetes bacterium]|nr:MFS transporter [Planctomycetota bacterium]
MSSAPPLPLRVQAGYSVAEIGLNLVETTMRIYALKFYTDTVALDAGLAGLAIGLAIVWDAVTDPVMGAISDRTRHRFGGRRGYLPLGGALLALGVVAVFCPPQLVGAWAKFAWLLGASCFLNTGMTVLSVPYMAMAGEMTPDPHQRAKLFGWRFAGANLGALAAAALPALFLVEAGGGAAAMPQVSFAAAAIVVASALATWRATARVAFQAPPPAAGARGGPSPWRNPTFRPLLLAYVVATAGIGVNGATFLYYYEHRLRLPAAATQTVLVVFLLVFTLSILGWVAVARWCGKRRPVVMGATVLGTGTALLYLLAAPGDFWPVLTLGAIGLGSFVGCIVLIEAMLTDVLDYDLLRTRRARAGLYFGIWRFASKLARALAVGAVGPLLAWVGYREGAATQPAAVERALVLLFGPGVGGTFLLAAGILAVYRFGDPKQAQVRRLLARRRARTTVA